MHEPIITLALSDESSTSERVAEAIRELFAYEIEEKRLAGLQIIRSRARARRDLVQLQAKAARSDNWIPAELAARLKDLNRKGRRAAASQLRRGRPVT